MSEDARDNAQVLSVHRSIHIQYGSRAPFSLFPHRHHRPLAVVEMEERSTTERKTRSDIFFDGTIRMFNEIDREVELIDFLLLDRLIYHFESVNGRKTVVC